MGLPTAFVAGLLVNSAVCAAPITFDFAVTMSEPESRSPPPVGQPIGSIVRGSYTFETDDIVFRTDYIDQTLSGGVTSLDFTFAGVEYIFDHFSIHIENDSVRSFTPCPNTLGLPFDFMRFDGGGFKIEAIDCSGNLFKVNSLSDYLIPIRWTGGVRTYSGTELSVPGYGLFDISPQFITPRLPEPGTLALVCAALAGAVASRRRNWI